MVCLTFGKRIHFQLKNDSQKLRDIYITNWHAQLDKSDSATSYKIFKITFGMEKYLVTLPVKLRKAFIKIRTNNHRLPNETGRWRRAAM